MTNKFKKKILISSLSFVYFFGLVGISDQVLAEDTKVTESKTEEVQKNSNTTSSSSGEQTSTKEVEQKIKVEAPSSVTGQKTEGQGTVIDFTTTNAKNFFTIKDKEGNIFYLIIDMEKTDNNVYFVSDVDKSTMENSGNTSNNNINQQVTNQQQATNQQTANSNSNTKDSSSKDDGFLRNVLIVFVIAVVGYYFLIFKKKKGNHDKNTNSKNNDSDLENADDQEYYGELSSDLEDSDEKIQIQEQEENYEEQYEEQ